MGKPTYRFVCTKSFWREYEALSPEKRSAADEAFKVFKRDPFAGELKTHRIHRLTALHRRTVWSVTVLGNLKSLFTINGDTITSISIGNHDVYK